MVYNSVIEKGPVPALPNAVWTFVPMALKASVESALPVNRAFVGEINVDSVTVHPAGRRFDVKELRKALTPKGESRP
jgi:hypothetical protein